MYKVIWFTSKMGHIPFPYRDRKTEITDERYTKSMIIWKKLLQTKIATLSSKRSHYQTAIRARPPLRRHRQRDKIPEARVGAGSGTSRLQDTKEFHGVRSGSGRLCAAYVSKNNGISASVFPKSICYSMSACTPFFFIISSPFSNIYGEVVRQYHVFPTGCPSECTLL